MTSGAAAPTFEELGSLRSDVETFLQEFSGNEILFYPNPGNGGDSLIATATLQAFDRSRIPCRIIDLNSRVEGAVVFLGGGGNLIPYYDDIANAIANFHGRARRLVLLPHTIRANHDLLSRLDSSCTIFARDVKSYDHVRSTNPSLDVRLGHDMAFHLDVDQLLMDAALSQAAEGIRDELLARHHLSVGLLGRLQEVQFLRLDVEAASKSPASDVDLSSLLTLGVGPSDAPVAAWSLLTTVGSCNRVATDRLHVGIAAALAGIPCVIYDNDYGKNQSVYEHSLTAFRNIVFKASAAPHVDVERIADLESVKSLESELAAVAAIVGSFRDESGVRSEDSPQAFHPGWLATAVAEMQTSVVRTRADLAESERQRSQVSDQLSGVLNSNSWRWTAPLRRLRSVRRA